MVREGLLSDGDQPALMGAHCLRCAHDHFPATDTCPYCGAATVEPVLLPTTGTLWAWTAVTAAPPGYTGRVPFGFGVVELGGRMRVVSRLTADDPAALHAGQTMRLVRDVVTAVPPDEGTTPQCSWAFAPEQP